MGHFTAAILRAATICGFLTTAIFVPVERLKRSAMAIHCQAVNAQSGTKRARQKPQIVAARSIKYKLG